MAGVDGDGGADSDEDRLERVEAEPPPLHDLERDQPQPGQDGHRSGPSMCHEPENGGRAEADADAGREQDPGEPPVGEGGVGQHRRRQPEQGPVRVDGQERAGHQGQTAGQQLREQHDPLGARTR
jgi:hypothetical protein